MTITLSVIKAGVGSIGGHICPSRAVCEAVFLQLQEHGKEKGLIINSYLRSTATGRSPNPSTNSLGPLYSPAPPSRNSRIC